MHESHNQASYDLVSRDRVGREEVTTAISDNLYSSFAMCHSRVGKSQKGHM